MVDSSFGSARQLAALGRRIVAEVPFARRLAPRGGDDRAALAGRGRCADLLVQRGTVALWADRRMAGAQQRFECVAAGRATVVVQGHGDLISVSGGWGAADRVL